YVNLFIPSTVKWKDQGVTLTQTTQFPEAGRTTLSIEAAKPAELTLNIRHPSWCAEATVRVNNALARTSRDPGTYIAIKRTWSTGDVVELELPMTLRVEALPGTTDRAAILSGPIVLVGALGKQGISPGADLHVNERTIGSVLNDAIDVPELVGELA